jgi:arsenical pump membrane protein
LLASLAFAVVRPRGLVEAVVAVPAAALVVALGIVSWHEAAHTLREIGPTVAFLAAILVFGHLCADAGVFDHLGAVAARMARGSPNRLLWLVVVLAGAVTATLTLDATVVLLTPVVLATAARAELPARPYAYACVRLANSASLLLPVSNLTNLLAFSTAHVPFRHFVALMALPWLVVCGLEWAGLRLWFRRELRTRAGTRPRVPEPPRYALAVLALTVAGFVLTSAFRVAPAWAALGGCLALLVPRIVAGTVSYRRVVAEASIGFCLFVLALAVVVAAVTRHGLGSLLVHAVPGGSSWAGLLAVTVIAAALAVVLNNLPATLALTPVVSGRPELVLAVLLGVNIGPNLAYPGSLATLLWRRQLTGTNRPRAGEFHALGAASVPILLVAASTALWLGHAAGL